MFKKNFIVFDCFCQFNSLFWNIAALLSELLGKSMWQNAVLKILRSKETCLKSILAQCSISIPHENVRKPKIFRGWNIRIKWVKQYLRTYGEWACFKWTDKCSKFFWLWKNIQSSLLAKKMESTCNFINNF